MPTALALTLVWFSVVPWVVDEVWSPVELWPAVELSVDCPPVEETMEEEVEVRELVDEVVEVVPRVLEDEVDKDTELVLLAEPELVEVEVPQKGFFSVTLRTHPVIIENN